MTGPDATALFAALALPFLAAAVTPLVYRLLGERTAYFAAAVALACFGLLASQFGTHGAASVPWVPAMGVELRLYLDGLALLIGFLASGVGVLIFTYSGGYMHGEPGQAKYYTTLLVFMGAMLGVALTADLVALFVFWELTSVSSFVLIGHYQRESSSLYAARKSMLITVAGGLFMLAGFLLLAMAAGDVAGLGRTFALAGPDSLLANAEAVREVLEAQGLLVPALVLIGIGAAAKSAQVPLHIWLPNAMEAPTPVSAFLHSATMVKAGVYLVGRFRPLLGSEEWMLLFAAMGLLTMTVAAVLAVGATDIKELLAYSTASHLGLIIAGFGMLPVLGAETGAFHILNHAVFKAALFLVAGIVAHEAGTRALDELSGLRHDLPITAGITVIAALGMAGVPPFNGFYSKELLFEAAYDVAAHDGGLWWLLPVVAVLGSVFTFLYSIRFLAMFFGEKPEELGHVHSPPWSMLAPPLVLAALAAVIGAVPQFAIDVIVGSVLESVAHGAHEMHVGLPTKLKPAVLMSAVTIALGVVAWPFYDRIHDAIRRLRAVPYWSPNAYYDGAIAGFEAASSLVGHVQTGVLRTYAAVVLLATSLLTLGAYALGGVTLPPTGAFIDPALAVVLLVAVAGALAVARANSHIAGVLTLSILGFMVAIFYILADAPDLALTQLVVETLVLVIFLLVLDKLPAFYAEGWADRSRTAVNAVVAVLVGTTVSISVLLATSTTPKDPISEFLVRRAGLPEGHHAGVLVDYGGGGNIVNVILVDFRAIDTMGEISVIAIAALSVVTLVAMRGRGERG